MWHKLLLPGLKKEEECGTNCSPRSLGREEECCTKKCPRSYPGVKNVAHRGVPGAWERGRTLHKEVSQEPGRVEVCVVNVMKREPETDKFNTFCQF